MEHALASVAAELVTTYTNRFLVTSAKCERHAPAPRCDYVLTTRLNVICIATVCTLEVWATVRTLLQFGQCEVHALASVVISYLTTSTHCLLLTTAKYRNRVYN
nr:unnamed protein product [Haemonchus contortus]